MADAPPTTATRSRSTARSDNVVRLSDLSRNAITGIALIGASRNHVTANRIADNGYNGAVVVEGSDDNEVAANAIHGGELGVIVDTAARNLVTLNHVDGAADGILVAGDANTVKANAVDGAKGGCEGCFGYGIGVLSGTGNVVKANLVSRAAADGINAVAGTWVGLNVALRNAALGINAVGSTDGGGNRAAQNGNAAQCAGVTCRSSSPPRGGHREIERLRDQLIGAATGAVVIGDRDHDHLLRAVLGRRLLDAGLHLSRGPDDRPPPHRGPVALLAREEALGGLGRRHRDQAAAAQHRERHPAAGRELLRLLLASPRPGAHTATVVRGASRRTPSANPRR